MTRNDLSEKTEKDMMNYIKAELIIWYQDHADKFLLQRYLKYRNLFIQRYCKKGFSEFFNLNKDNKKFVFEMFIKDFKEWCEQNEKIDGLFKLDVMENNIKETEKTFLKLVCLVYTFTRRRKEIDWSVEEIANGVLCHMSEYEKNNHPVNMTIEEDMLDCLLFNIPNYQETDWLNVLTVT